MGIFMFQVFERSGDRHQDPYITLEKGGVIYVNGAAGRLLGRADKVVLLYDPQRRAGGIQTAEADTAKFHVAAVLAKLGATSRAEAVTLGARRGYLLL
jgi:aspartate 1-decarboxylase